MTREDMIDLAVHATLDESFIASIAMSHPRGRGLSECACCVEAVRDVQKAFSGLAAQNFVVPGRKMLAADIGVEVPA